MCVCVGVYKCVNVCGDFCANFPGENCEFFVPFRKRKISWSSRWNSWIQPSFVRCSVVCHCVCVCVCVCVWVCVCVCVCVGGCVCRERERFLYRVINPDFAPHAQYTHHAVPTLEKFLYTICHTPTYTHTQPHTHTLHTMPPTHTHTSLCCMYTNVHWVWTESVCANLFPRKKILPGTKNPPKRGGFLQPHLPFPSPLPLLLPPFLLPLLQNSESVCKTCLQTFPLKTAQL